MSEKEKTQNEYKEIRELSLNFNWLLRDNCNLVNNMLLDTKVLCQKIQGMKVLIYTNDHTPSHFHVKANNPKMDCKFRIDNCDKINGEISSKNYKKIKFWFENGYCGSKIGKEILEEKWKEFHE